jgi:hypothetical protein
MRFSISSRGTLSNKNSVKQVPLTLSVAQIANQMKSERRAYEYIRQRSEHDGDQKTLRQLATYPVPESDEAIKSFFRSLLRD